MRAPRWLIDLDRSVSAYVTPTVRALIYINVLVWFAYVLLVVLILPGSSASNMVLLNRWFGCTPMAILGLRVWQFVTYMFLHDVEYLSHLVFNMLMLWFFGSVLEGQWGGRRFLRFYLLCGVVAALVYEAVVLIRAFVFGDPGPFYPMIGASGAIYGVLFAFGYLYPEAPVLFGLFIPVPARVLVAILILFSVLGSLGVTHDNTAHLCHLAGMGVAYAYLKWPRWTGRGRGPRPVRFRDLYRG